MSASACEKLCLQQPPTEQKELHPTSWVLGANQHQASQDFSLAFWKQTGAARPTLLITAGDGPETSVCVSQPNTVHESINTWTVTVLSSPINWLLSLKKLLNAGSEVKCQKLQHSQISSCRNQDIKSPSYRMWYNLPPSATEQYNLFQFAQVSPASCLMPTYLTCL